MIPPFSGQKITIRNTFSRILERIDETSLIVLTGIYQNLIQVLLKINLEPEKF